MHFKQKDILNDDPLDEFSTLEEIRRNRIRNWGEKKNNNTSDKYFIERCSTNVTATLEIYYNKPSLKRWHKIMMRSK